MKLYEITDQHKQLESIEPTGEATLDEAIAETFEMIEGAFNEKAVSLITVVNNMDADTAALDHEIKRLQARKNVINNQQAGLREYLRTNMETTGITKITCPLFGITLAKGRQIVQINDEEKIPTDYLKMVVSKSPMKKELLEDLKAGKEIAGVSLTTSKTSLRIK
jgi:hypothetical protein